MFSHLPQIILASQSPRRSFLLQQAGFRFEQRVKEIDESDFPPDMPPHQVPQYLAEKKALALLPDLQPDDLVLAADTIVLLNGSIYGKAANEEEACHTLHALSGKKHEVVSGVCFLSRQHRHCFSEVTEVYFKPLSDGQIRHYVARYQPFDKAGSYAIQEWIGLVGIEKINGCYFNVMGLPIARLVTELEKFLNH